MLLLSCSWCLGLDRNTIDAYAPRASDISVDLNVERLAARRPYRSRISARKPLPEILGPLCHRWFRTSSPSSPQQTV